MMHMLVRVLQEMKQVMTDQFNELLEASDLSPADKERLKAKLIDGFNAIAEAELQ